MTAAASVVTVERHDNVIVLGFVRHETPIPARLSPRPLRVLRRRFARSQLAAEMREWGVVVGLLAALVLCLVVHDQLTALSHTLTGGLPR